MISRHFLIAPVEIQVMTTKRMVQLRIHPLTHGELINALSTKDPVYREEEEAFIGAIMFLREIGIGNDNDNEQ